MKKIKLTKSKFALVDNSDFEELNKYKWYCFKYGNTYYAMRSSNRIKGKQTVIKMHRFLMNPLKGQQIDHVDGNGLNNQRKNLRICNHSENQRNKKIYKSNISGFKGVSWNKNANKWQSFIRVDSKRIHLGYFKSKLSAFETYCKASVEFHGKFSRFK
jgi:hypothetical protein